MISAVGLSMTLLLNKQLSKHKNHLHRSHNHFEKSFSSMDGKSDLRNTGAFFGDGCSR